MKQEQIAAVGSRYEELNNRLQDTLREMQVFFKDSQTIEVLESPEATEALEDLCIPGSFEAYMDFMINSSVE